MHELRCVCVWQDDAPFLFFDPTLAGYDDKKTKAYKKWVHAFFAEECMKWQDMFENEYAEGDDEEAEGKEAAEAAATAKEYGLRTAEEYVASFRFEGGVWCEAGEHYVSRLWPDFGDCFDCASAKEYAEAKGISIAEAEAIAEGQ